MARLSSKGWFRLNKSEPKKVGPFSEVRRQKERPISEVEQ